MIAKTMLEEAMGVHGIPEAAHADRSTSMTSKPVAQMLLDLGVDRSHSRPRVSNDNPYSEAAYKTLKYAQSSPKCSDPWPTRGRSARSSSATTTTSTVTPGSGCTLLRRCITAPRPRSAPSVSTPGCSPRHSTRAVRRPSTPATEAAQGRLDQPAITGGAHTGRVTIAGVCARIAQRVLALTAAIWHNDNLGLAVRPSLTAHDH